jgi:hypothetical protein
MFESSLRWEAIRQNLFESKIVAEVFVRSQQAQAHFLSCSRNRS